MKSLKSMIFLCKINVHKTYIAHSISSLYRYRKAGQYGKSQGYRLRVPNAGFRTGDIQSVLVQFIIY
jgi:hypothetical protein